MRRPNRQRLCGECVDVTSRSFRGDSRCGWSILKPRKPATPIHRGNAITVVLRSAGAGNYQMKNGASAPRVLSRGVRRLVRTRARDLARYASEILLARYTEELCGAVLTGKIAPEELHRWHPIHWPYTGRAQHVQKF